MEKLSNDIEVLKAIIKELLEKNPRLEADNAEWRRRFGMDSINRHKPPSSDGYAKKSLKPGLPKEKHTKGGQTGLQGKTLKRVAQADRLEIHLPGQCQCGGRPRTAADKDDVIGNRQVFVLPSPKLDVLEPRLGQIVMLRREATRRIPSQRHGVGAIWREGKSLDSLTVNRPLNAV
jgi:hypothetical protein